MQQHHLACDLGAESGRLMLGTLAGGLLTLEEIHRFANTAVTVNGSLQWDIAGLFTHLKDGLRRVAARGIRARSFSTDSWGVDYLLLDGEGRILDPVHHYRDPRCHRGVERAHATLPQAAIFDETGIQFMAINTLFQLASEDPARLRSARVFLMIADAFNHLLGGRPCIEVSNASTSQLYNPRTRRWSDRLVAALGLPAELFPEIVPSGTPVGRLSPNLAQELGLAAFEIIAGCSHDTGAAVVAVPAIASGVAGSPPDWAYLSSGTWSLLGCELSEPLVTDACRAANFTNEIGFGNSVRLLKNIAGLWLVQECRRAWSAEGKDYSYAELARLAAEAPPFRAVVDPADDRFIAPGDMPGRIAAFCRETGQPVPDSPGACVRCCLESLALAYASNLRQLEGLVGTRFRRLHIVGGGSQNEFLNQLAADACGVEVVSGPVEATAAGNVLVQGIALGEVPSLAAAREIVRRSFPVRHESPGGDPEAWRAAARALGKRRG